MTGDENSVIFNNVQCKRQRIDNDRSPQLTRKVELDENEFMMDILDSFCVFKPQSNGTIQTYDLNSYNVRMEIL